MGTLLELAEGGTLPSDFPEYVDLGSGLKRVAGNETIFLKLLKSFLAGGQTGKLRQQTQSGDIEAATETAHGLKGVSGNLSLPKLYEAVTRFEARLKQGEADATSWDEVFPVAEKTEEYIRTLVESIS